MKLSTKLNNTISDLTEAAEALENDLEKEKKKVQDIVNKCEKAIKYAKYKDSILRMIVEEYKEDI